MVRVARSKLVDLHGNLMKVARNRIISVSESAGNQQIEIGRNSTASVQENDYTLKVRAHLCI